jgi:uroporphyrinogen III methyltransferase / synthase
MGFAMDESKEFGFFVPGAAVSGTVYLVGGGPGDPSLLTLRGAELLASADVVLHDELVHPALLDLARKDAVVRAVGKRGSDLGSKQAKQDAIEAELVFYGLAGKSVVRLKGGDPYLFGRGSEEAEALVRAGIPFEVVPGIPSPLGATAYAGFSVTHRDFASSVIFVSGTTRAGRIFDFSEIASVRGTVCVLMAMHHLDEVVAGLVGPGKRDLNEPVAAIQWGTWAKQRVVLGVLGDIVEKVRVSGAGSPAIVLVGRVATLREELRWFDSRPLFGKRVLVLRPSSQAASTAKILRGRGAEAIAWPAIEIGPPPDTAPLAGLVRTLGEWDVVAFTSENGVEKFFMAVEEAGLDARVFGRSLVAAIGSGTAAALLARGIKADIVPRDFRGEALAEAITMHPLVAARLSEQKPVRVVIPRALVAREVLPALLRERGCEALVVPAYETKTANEDRKTELRRMLSRKEVDVVLLSSSSTAKALSEALGEQTKALLASVVVASIGLVTTESARNLGIDVEVTATTSTMPGLIQALEAHYANLPNAETNQNTRMGLE